MGWGRWASALLLHQQIRAGSLLPKRVQFPTLATCASPAGRCRRQRHGAASAFAQQRKTWMQNVDAPCLEH